MRQTDAPKTKSDWHETCKLLVFLDSPKKCKVEKIFRSLSFITIFNVYQVSSSIFKLLHFLKKMNQARK